MGQELLSSKVVILEEEPRIRSIQGVQTSIVGCVGVTERGPIGVPTLVTSFDEYRAIFGGFTADSDVATALNGFFEEGGQFCYVVRTVHYTDPSNPATKTSAASTATLSTGSGGATAGVVLGTASEPFDLEPGDTLIVDPDGAGNETVTFAAAPAAETSGNTSTFTLANGEVLDVEIDGGASQQVTFLTGSFVDIANATDLEVAAVLNAGLTGASASVAGGAVTITSDKRGTGSFVQVTGGSANVGLAFPTALIQGTGDAADIDAVTVAEVKAHVEANVTGSSGVTVNDVGGSVQIVSNTTGLASTVQVDATSTADSTLGLDNAVHTGTSGLPVPTLTVSGKTDGTYADDLSVEVSAATSGAADEFNLNVLEDGVIVETYPNLSMVDGADRYAEDVVNAGSNLIEVLDLDAAVSVQRPANTTTPLAGGDDGLAGLVDNDYIGDSAGATGIRAFDVVQDLNLLIVPGQATGPVQTAMVNYCELVRDGSMFAILDSPAAQSPTDVIAYVDAAGLANLSEYGAIYWPHVEVLNPARGVFGDTDRITIAPSGNIAGVYARGDAARPGGVYVPPAGIENGVLRGVVGFETDDVLDERKRDLVAPKRINILTTFPGAPQFIDGSDCLKGGGNFPYVSQRRGAIFIEQSIKRGIEFARHQNNNAKLRREVERTIRGFLLVQMRNGAFETTNPNTAFFVNFSDALNPPSEVAAGKLNGRVGLAFNTPAEFIVIRFSKDTRALETELAGS